MTGVDDVIRYARAYGRNGCEEMPGNLKGVRLGKDFLFSDFGSFEKQFTSIGDFCVIFIYLWKVIKTADP